MKRSFDKLAPIYSTLERALFWKQLKRARMHGLAAFDPRIPQRALVLGDGDGRFSAAALKRNPLLQIDSIDSSSAMLARAQRRIRSLGPLARRRYQPIQHDARTRAIPSETYDVVVAQFFLDCFTSVDANRLIVGIEKALPVDGKFVYADFATNSGKRRHRWMITLLYTLFRMTTDIRSKTLPRLEWPYSLLLDDQRRWRKGLIVSEIRRKTSR